MEKKDCVLDVINSHSSVRRFTDQDVSLEDEKRIVRAGQMASTSCNMQPYCFISVRNRETREMIAGINAGAAPAGRAPLVLVVCVDQYKLEVISRKSGVEYYQSEFLDSFVMGVADASLAAQNAALAAESLGYGICYLGSIRSAVEELREWLEMPERVFPVFALAIGTPAKKNRVKPRLPIEGIWFRERYDREDMEKSMETYDAQMAATRIYTGRHYPLAGCRIRPNVEKVEEATYGWIEHTARRISRQGRHDTRPDLRRILEKIGFRFE